MLVKNFLLLISMLVGSFVGTIPALIYSHSFVVSVLIGSVIGLLFGLFRLFRMFRKSEKKLGEILKQAHHFDKNADYLLDRMKGRILSTMTVLVMAVAVASGFDKFGFWGIFAGVAAGGAISGLMVGFWYVLHVVMHISFFAFFILPLTALRGASRFFRKVSDFLFAPVEQWSKELQSAV